MSPQFLLIATIVGGGFATTATMWLVGMAVDRARKPSKRPLWVTAAVVAMVVAGGLASGAGYAIYLGASVHGWFVQKTTEVFGDSWAVELGVLMVAVWILAFVVGGGLPIVLAQSQQGYGPPQLTEPKA